MSVVGVSVGDFFLVSKVAWQLYKSCKESPAEFSSLSADVVNLYNVLVETEDNVVQRSLRPDQQDRLRGITAACRELLAGLEKLLRRCDSLGPKTQRTWDRMRWCSEDISGIRDQLVSNTLLLTAFNTTLAK